MIIPVGYAHIQHFFSGANLPQGAAITYGVGGFGENDPATLAALLHDALGDTWAGNWSTGITLSETRAKFGPNASGPFGSHVEARAGTNVSSALPPNVALLIEKRTNAGGRDGRGRLYMPGIVEPNVDAAGFIVPGAITTYQTAATAWRTRINEVTTGMFVFHRSASDPTPVTALQIDPVAATQRRRLR